MRNLKLRHLKIVEELHRSGSLKIAASRLGLTPAAVSKACLELEATLRVALFLRSPTGMTPTDICYSVVKSFRTIRTEIETLFAQIDASLEATTTVLHIGFQAPALEKVIMRAVANLKQQNPSIRIRMTHASRQDLLRGLEDGVYNLVLTDLFNVKSDPAFVTAVIHSDNCFIMSPAGAVSVPHVLSRWSDYEAELWILPIKGIAGRDRFEAVLASRDLASPKNVIEFNTRFGLDELTRHMAGHMIVPNFALDLARQMTPVPEDMPCMEEMELESGAVWSARHPLSSTTQAIIDYLIQSRDAMPERSTFQISRLQ